MINNRDLHNSSQRILIVCRTFPPQGGVGGRRWAKFAKYMRRGGVEVEVIAADLGGGGSSWTDDVAGIPVFRYKEEYPAVLMRRPVKVWEKIAYRIALFSLRRQCEGTPYDRAVRDKDAFLAIFHRRMIEFRPDVVVVSGAPFNLLHYVAQVRDVYGGVRF